MLYDENGEKRDKFATKPAESGVRLTSHDQRGKCSIEMRCRVDKRNRECRDACQGREGNKRSIENTHDNDLDE